MEWPRGKEVLGTAWPIVPDRQRTFVYQRRGRKLQEEEKGLLCLLILQLGCFMEGKILKGKMGMQETTRAVQRNPYGVFLSLGGRWFLIALPMRMAIKEPKRR